MSDEQHLVQKLLSKPNDDKTLKYFSELQQGRAGIAVRLDAGGGRGKGLFACLPFSEGDEIFRELPVVGDQHIDNRPHALVCAQCFRYVGSLELQIGARLAATRPDADSTARALLDGSLQLPRDGLSPSDAAATCLPLAVASPGGCGRLFCSHDCAAAAWRSWLCLLSTRRRSPLEYRIAASPYVQPFDIRQASAALQTGWPGAEARQPGDTADAASSSQPAAAHSPLPAWIAAPSDARWLSEFYAHAARSNDIFVVAARAVAVVLSEARHAVWQRGAAVGSTAEVPANAVPGDGAALSDSGAAGGGAGEAIGEAVAQAWLPFWVAHKAVWWESVPPPDATVSEREWQDSIREMACDSLELLRRAIPHGDAPALFDERIWGSVIGMFELNNLSLEVQSPVESYFLAIDALEGDDREAATLVTQPLLDALDKDYDISCSGTAFYALQSCMNHAHAPNVEAVKSDADLDGSAVLLAKRPVVAGDELCISYVDEAAPLDDRMAALRDYGIYA